MSVMCSPCASVSSAPKIGLTEASRHALEKRTAPVRASWSVSATASKPRLRARCGRASAGMAPSSSDQVVWQCRCVNAPMPAGSVPDPSHAPAARYPVPEDIVDRAVGDQKAVGVDLAGGEALGRPGQHPVELPVLPLSAVVSAPEPPLRALTPRHQRLVDVVASASPHERERSPGACRVRRHVDVLVIALGHPLSLIHI